MIKKLIYFILILITLTAVLLCTAIYLSVDDEANVAAANAISETDVNSIKEIIGANSPAAVLSKGKQQLSLTNDQANKILMYANLQYERSLRAHTIFHNKKIEAKFSYILPDNPIGKFLNIRVKARVHYAKYFIIEELDIGHLSVPAFLIDYLQPEIVKLAKKKYGSYFVLWKHIKRIDINQTDLTVHYQIQRTDFKKLKKVARKILVDNEMRERITAYSDELDKVLNQLPSGNQSVIKVLSPMFKFAERRSLFSNKTVAENRVAIMTLAAFVLDRNLLAHISSEPIKERKKVTLTLKGRDDLAKHFLVSSAINAMTNRVWSSAIGLHKELRDSEGRSGFSFVDLMADIAGNKLADIAFAENTATQLQTKLVHLNSEDEIMGDISGLQEGLSKKEFRMEFGTTNSDEYIRVVREVRRRLRSCSVYKK